MYRNCSTPSTGDLINYTALLKQGSNYETIVVNISLPAHTDKPGVALILVTRLVGFSFISYATSISM